MLLETLLVIAVGAFIVHQMLTSTKKKLKLPPGPTGISFVGNMFQVSTKPQETYCKWREEFGDLYHLKFGADHVFVLGSSKIVRDFYNEPAFQGRHRGMLTSILAGGKNGVVLSDGPPWVEQRRFTLRHLRDFGFGKNYMESLIMEEVMDVIEGLKKEEGQPIRMNEKFSLSVINALWTIIAGKKFKQDDADMLELLKEIDRTFAMLNITGILYLMAPSVLKLAPELLGYNNAVRIGERLSKFLKGVIKEHQDSLPEDGNPRDFIDAYLQEIKRTDDENSSFYKEQGIVSLCAGIGDLFFAGAETTSSTLNWSVLLLAVHPEIQKKVQDEIDTVVGRSRPVSLLDRPKLPFVEATIQEILRKSSIVVAGVFHTAMEDATFYDFDIPKGSWLMANLYGIHHCKKIWGDPETFRPQRFLSDDGKSVIRNENLLAFSIGKRVCLGETLARDEIFLFLTNIFQRFTVKVDESKSKVNLEPKEGFILQPHEYNVILKDRLA